MDSKLDSDNMQHTSDLAHCKSNPPYIFDFLSIGAEAQECKVEKALLQHMKKFILELEAGGTFVGRQYHLGEET